MEKIRDTMKQLLGDCMELSTTTDADAFFSYSPHVNMVSVTIYPTGWSEHSNSPVTLSVYALNSGDQSTEAQATHALETIRNMLKVLGEEESAV